MLRYKVIELSIVTDETMEAALNSAASSGWSFDRINFVVKDSSKRPAMAFLFFTRNRPQED